MKNVDEGDGFMGKFASPDGRQAVIIEDDGKVCYAYLLDGAGTICGDVWLYNRRAAPVEPEWHDPRNAPFANPASFVDQNVIFSPPATIDDITIDWGEESGASTARVFLFQRLFAILMDGAKPGWALLAGRDGPLANVLKTPPARKVANSTRKSTKP